MLRHLEIFTLLFHHGLLEALLPPAPFGLILGYLLRWMFSMPLPFCFLKKRTPDEKHFGWLNLVFLVTIALIQTDMLYFHWEPPRWFWFRSKTAWEHHCRSWSSAHWLCWPRHRPSSFALSAAAHLNQTRATSWVSNSNSYNRSSGSAYRFLSARHDCKARFYLRCGYCYHLHPIDRKTEAHGR